MAQASKLNNLPTYAQILERVEALLPTCAICEDSVDVKCGCAGAGRKKEANELRIAVAQAIQAAMVEALRWAMEEARKPYFYKSLREAADALEKGEDAKT